jgi:hypothetical protein
MLTRGEIKMSKLLVLLAILVASMAAPALAADGTTNCYHFRCDTGPLQVQVPTVPHPRGDVHG